MNLIDTHGVWRRRGMVVVVLVVIASSYWYWQSRGTSLEDDRARPTPVLMALPKEIVSGYDARESKVVFAVESVEGERLQVSVSWPPAMQGKTSSLDMQCQEGIVVRASGGESTRLSREQFLAKVRQTERERMALSGLCGEESCKSLVKDCELYISGGSGDV